MVPRSLFRVVIAALISSTLCTTVATAFIVPVAIRTTSRKHQQHVLSSSSRNVPSDRQDQAVLRTDGARPLSSLVQSVNYFMSRACNYQCGFCFHTQKNTHRLDLLDAMHGLQLLRQAGTQKINFAGGEPFLQAHFLGQLCQYAHELGMAVSIISNGSLITAEWMERYGHYVDVLGVSVDSFDKQTNLAIGRHSAMGNDHVQQVLQVREWCHDYGISFKLNTVVCRYNHQEDMTAWIQQLKPDRWKIFQVLILEGENSGNEGELRDAQPFCVSSQEFSNFVRRHQESLPQELVEGVLIPESNTVMQNSYLLLDEDLRFLDCSQGGKVPSESILKVGVERALAQSGFDVDMFEQRGGVYNWTRDRTTNSTTAAVTAAP